jgi:hypothetical protein
MWYDLSASDGNSRAIAAPDSIAAQLDADELDHAQALAAEWCANRPGNGSVSVAAQTRRRASRTRSGMCRWRCTISAMRSARRMA